MFLTHSVPEVEYQLIFRKYTVRCGGKFSIPKFENLKKNSNLMRGANVFDVQCTGSRISADFSKIHCAAESLVPQNLKI